MSPIKFGCQFYTWQMSGERYVGKLPHILKVVEAAGFSGHRARNLDAGGLLSRAGGVGRRPRAAWACSSARSPSSAIGQVRSSSQAEREEAAYVIRYMQAFPAAHLVLCQMPGKDRSDLRQRQKNLISCVNSVARRATDQGIACSFHPNSPPGSIFRTSEDYRILLDGLDSRSVGFAPDTGHIVKGGIDVIALFTEYALADQTRPLQRYYRLGRMDRDGRRSYRFPPDRDDAARWRL